MVWRRMFGREELTPVEARQGFLDRPVLVILITSTAMVCIVFEMLLLGLLKRRERNFERELGVAALTDDAATCCGENLSTAEAAQ